MPDIAKASIDELEDALKARRQQRRAELEEQHRELSNQLRELEKEIDEIDGTKCVGRPRGAGRKTGPRPKNDMNLKDAITAYLKGEKKGRSKDEIADGVKAGGYLSNSDNFGNIVYQTLHRNTEHFRRGKDGTYTLTK